MAIDMTELGRRIIEFDPARPEARFFATATQMAAAIADGLEADEVTFPDGLAPTLDTAAAAPDPSAPLPPADVVIVTWTAAEADTLARLLTPGAPLASWYEYKSNLNHYLPLVNGNKAPFNDQKYARYYKSLGIYYPIKLVGKKVLCLKSGLHLDHDTNSPPPADLPMLDLWKQILQETGAELIITTGTGGAIGANVLLGDVVVAAHTVFDCTKQFAQEPFRETSYPTSSLPAGWKPPPAAMLAANAKRIAQSDQPSHPGGLPKFFYPGSSIADPRIVTTDEFAFDDTANSSGLQGLGQVCDMGDASLGLVISGMGPAAPLWAAIRNASDPQINSKLKDPGSTANSIYNTYGALTSVASVLATWSLICAQYAPSAALSALALAARTPAKAPAAATLAQKRRAVRQSDPTHLLMQMAASAGFSSKPAAAADLRNGEAAALARRLRAVGVDPDQSDIAWTLIRYRDETHRRRELTLAHVSSDAPKAFRGSYLQHEGKIVAKEEFASD